MMRVFGFPASRRGFVEVCFQQVYGTMFCCATLISEKILSGIICLDLNKILPGAKSLSQGSTASMEREFATELKRKAQVFIFCPQQRKPRAEKQRDGLHHEIRIPKEVSNSLLEVICPWLRWGGCHGVCSKHTKRQSNLSIPSSVYPQSLEACGLYPSGGSGGQVSVREPRSWLILAIGALGALRAARDQIWTSAGHTV